MKVNINTSTGVHISIHKNININTSVSIHISIKRRSFCSKETGRTDQLRGPWLEVSWRRFLWFPLPFATKVLLKIQCVVDKSISGSMLVYHNQEKKKAVLMTAMAPTTLHQETVLPVKTS